jgi:hypothetical protein
MADYPAPTREVPIFNPRDYPVKEINNQTSLDNLQANVEVLLDQVDTITVNSDRIGQFSTVSFTGVLPEVSNSQPIFITNIQLSGATQTWIVTVNLDTSNNSQQDLGRWYLWRNNNTSAYNQAYNNLCVWQYSSTDSASICWTFIRQTTPTGDNDCCLWAFNDTNYTLLGAVYPTAFSYGQVINSRLELVGMPDYTLTSTA